MEAFVRGVLKFAKKTGGDGNVGGDEILKGGLEILVNLLIIYKLSKSVLKQKRHYVNKNASYIVQLLVLDCICTFFIMLVGGS